MPELPEVETIRRQLAPLVEGRTVIDAGGHPSAKFASAVEATGRTIESVGRRGKYLMLALDDGRQLVIHLGMTGRLRLTDAGEAPGPYVRAWWDLGHERFELDDVRRFGRVAVIHPDDPSGLPTLAALGPEPFDPAFTGEHLWRALRASRVRVKTQLLSQRPVAGVGNIYADEALWRAGIHPGARVVSRAAAHALRDEITDVLSAAIDRGGTTLRDYRTVDGNPGTNQLHLECYGRAGEPCVRCGETLVRLVLDGRGTTMCRTCQGLRRRVDRSRPH